MAIAEVHARGSPWFQMPRLIYLANAAIAPATEIASQRADCVVSVVVAVAIFGKTA